MASYSTGFGVDQGFAFANTFTFDLQLAPWWRVGRISPGLCGGMAYAALDYYHAGAPIPSQTEPPAQDSALGRYLLERQLASNTASLVLQVVRWTLRDAQHLQARMLATELPALRARLQQGIPVVLVLIRAHSLREVTHNHQVVAYGYDEDADSRHMSIQVYDPNWPRRSIALTLDLASADGDLRPMHTIEGAFKGFILQAYTARQHGLPTM